MLALLPVQREGVAQGRSTPTRELGLCLRTQRIKHPQEAYGADLAGLVSWPLAINQTPQSHGLHERTKASNLDMIQDELQFRWLSPVGLRPNPKSAAQKVPRGSLLVENSPDDQGNTSSLCCGTSIDTKYATRLLVRLQISIVTILNRRYIPTSTTWAGTQFC
ncbi:hypothetical protein TWF173_002655 [Orbilia oligospora]|nr:hypothetical protein TWF173_002655 [Orbilia oligospora]